MQTAREKILIMEGEESKRRSLHDLILDAGYEPFSAESCEEALKWAQERGMDVLLLDPNFPGMQCTDLLAEIRGAAASAGIRVILLVSGGVHERIQRLDLGADDAVSRPWENSELLARVRVQLRAAKALKALQDRTEVAEEDRRVTQTAFEALAVTEKMSLDASRLGRGLKVGLAGILVAAAVMAVVFFRFSRRANRETQVASDVVARISRNLEDQENLVERARKISDNMETYVANGPQGQKRELERKSRNLRAQMASASSGEVAGLRDQLVKTEARLREIQSESSMAERIIRSYAPGVCLIHVVVGYQDPATGQSLRFVGLNADGQPMQDSKGNPLLTLGGTGPDVKVDALGTGFLVAPGGVILTNHHVVEPWWKNQELSPLTRHGLVPKVLAMAAYFPGSPRAFPVKVDSISPRADLALVRGDVSSLKIIPLPIDGRHEASISGEPVVLMGYATGIDALLARADDSTLRSIAKESKGQSDLVLDELAKRNLIRPVVTQGHIGDVLPDKIVYDAQTTSGGSGGPLFNSNGKVIGVNYAILEGFGGSNFGIPIRYSQPLLAGVRPEAKNASR
jgi:S1-C subfamily serine protease/CheY-like chemotaxis protein